MKISKLKSYIKEILIFIVIMVIFANMISFYKSRDLSTKFVPLVNISLIDSSKYNFSKNKPLLLHFWATWCPVCKIEASNIEKLSKKYEILTIAVNSGSDETIKAYMNENNLNFKVFNDTSGLVSEQYNIKVFPTTLIYDKNKKLIFSDVGYTSTLGLYFRMWWSSL